MSLILGIDTGGTYTDAVIIEYTTKKILRKAKALTTKEDLSVGIESALNDLNFSGLREVALVSLSTTLATNAIVEGQGCRTGLILIGGTPEGILPSEETVKIQGKFDIKGRMLQQLDEEEIRQAAGFLRGKVDAIAISGYASVRNPAHELFVRDRIREILRIPVVCAHDLTSSLGFYERTVTAILNARLIPIIDELMIHTKKVLAINNIQAPMMIVKGDGSLMHESRAREKPIETILSGPAASIIGGIFLTGQQDGLVVDMGGTTTDLAAIRGGAPKIREEGATVGGWMTRVKAADLRTFGIGGDSRVRVGQDGRLRVGPQKSWPLSVLSSRFPPMLDELKAYNKAGSFSGNHLNQSGFPDIPEADFYYFVKIPEGVTISEQEEKIMELLRDQPHNRSYLTKRLGFPPEREALKRMVRLGILTRSSLTPTDILHVEGTYTEWNREMAEAAAALYAEGMGLPLDRFVSEVREYMTNRLYEACRSSSWSGPIIALGAPVTAWMEEVGERLGVPLLIPAYSEVANAVGAAAGQVINTVEILIRPDHMTKKFVVFAPWERISFDTLEEAANYGVEHGKQYAAESARGEEADSFDYFIQREDVYGREDYLKTAEYFAETKIKVIATEKSSWRS